MEARVSPLAELSINDKVKVAVYVIGFTSIPQLIMAIFASMHCKNQQIKLCPQHPTTLNAIVDRVPVKAINFDIYFPPKWVVGVAFIDTISGIALVMTSRTAGLVNDALWACSFFHTSLM